MDAIKELYQHSKNLNILYVEDDKMVLEEMNTFLEDIFASVSIASDGEEGLKLYKKQLERTNKYFDLVITDVNMPKKNGLELIKDIRIINKDQTVLVVSAYNESVNLMKLIDIGIANFIMKPIQNEKFIFILHTICKNLNNEKERDKLFISQLKLASMGQMIENIAHQWKQPLAQINSIVLSLDYDLEESSCKNKVIENRLSEIEAMTKYMGRTISDFQHYYKPNKKTTIFSLTEVLQDVLVILKPSKSFSKIKLDIDVDMTFMVEGVKNELQQVILIILNNAKEILIDREIQNPNIKIKVKKVEGFYEITIVDNGGGVDQDVLEQIFELYFTKKSNSERTGLGLYISKNIIENHFDGEMSIKNGELGASVKILLPAKYK